MTTTKMIELLKKHEHGGATGRPREVMFCVGDEVYDTNITGISTGDGLITELFLEIDAQPERKKGKWIKHSIGHEHTPWGFDCSECGEWFVVGKEIVKKYNYCPNCGADMKGEQP